MGHAGKVLPRKTVGSGMIRLELEILGVEARRAHQVEDNFHAGHRVGLERCWICVLRRGVAQKCLR